MSKYNKKRVKKKERKLLKNFNSCRIEEYKVPNKGLSGHPAQGLQVELQQGTLIVTKAQNARSKATI